MRQTARAAVLEKHPATLPNALYIYGLTSLNRKDTTAATSHLTKAIGIRKDSSEYEAVMLTADLLLGKKDYPAGAFIIHARLLDRFAFRGSQLRRRRSVQPPGKRSAGQAEICYALQLDPAYSQAYIGLGNLLSRYGKWKEALPRL